MAEEMHTPASDAGAETAVNEAPVTPVSESAAPPSSSAREAIEKAFAQVDGNAPQPRDPVTQRYAAKATESEPAPQATAAPVTPEAPPAATAPAPDRFSKEAKDAWAATPDAVRKETERAFSELTKGLSEYQQRWEPVKQFDEMARQSGK